MVIGLTQLNIVSPAGVQPSASEDDQRGIVAIGEFYHFAAIRSRLESRGHRFRTRKDSEIALNLYEERGFVPGRTARETMASLPYVNQKAVMALPDGAPAFEPGARTVLDPLLIVSL